MELDKIFENIMNESSLKEYFFYAPPHHEEDEEDTIIGYIAAVRDYQTRKTKYIDEDGNICNGKSQAKVFDTKGKADYYSYEHCPEGWTHFIITLKKSDVLNEADDTYKVKRLKETSTILLTSHHKTELPNSIPKRDGCSKCGNRSPDKVLQTLKYWCDDFNIDDFSGPDDNKRICVDCFKKICKNRGVSLKKKHQWIK